MKYRHPCEACGRVHILPLEAESDDHDRKARLHQCECGCYASLPNRIVPGVIIDAYEILTRLGKGGMGTVWRARQYRGSSGGQEWSREVALKIWEPAKDGKNDQFTRNLFVSEAQTLAEIQHPNVVTIHDFGTDGDVLYLVMELIKGKTLEQLIETTVFSEAQTLQFAYTIALALGDCWQQHRLLHRDLKPGNLILDRSNHLHILDLGLARVGENRRLDSIHGLAIGTPNYMSPEQSRGENVDPRSDIYSLGCTMFHLLTGKRPFSGMSRTEIIRAQRVQPVPGPHNEHPKVSKECQRILERMTQKSPEDRYQDWSELADELKLMVRQYPTSIALVEEPELGTHLSSSISTIPGKEFPFATPLHGSNEEATITPPTTPKRKASISPVGPVPQRPTSRRKRLTMLAALALPLVVVGLIIGILLMWPKLQTEVVFEQISKLRDRVHHLSAKLPQASQRPGAPVPLIKQRLDDANHSLVKRNIKEARKRLTSAHSEFRSYKGQFEEADWNRKAYLAAAQSAPKLTGNVSPEVAKLYDTFQATAQSGSNQFYKIANFPEAARKYEKASHIVYQVVPTRKLETVTAPRDAAWKAEANSWASEEWDEAESHYQQATKAIPQIKSPDIDDLLGKIDAASVQFTSARDSALNISERFDDLSKLASQLGVDERFKKSDLSGSAIQRLNTLKEQRNALVNLHGDQTIAAIEALLKTNAYCEAKLKSIEANNKLEMRVADQDAITRVLENWIGEHLDRGTPKESSLAGFVAASEAWKEGMAIVRANRNCPLVPPLAGELKNLANQLTTSENGLNTLNDWKTFQATLQDLKDDNFQQSKQIARQQIGVIEEKIRRDAKWTDIATRIQDSFEKADILAAENELGNADAFLQKYPDTDHKKWVTNQRSAYCSWLGEVMNPVGAPSLQALEANLEGLEAIGSLCELIKKPVVTCPDQKVWDYISQFDALTNFLQALKTPPGWDLSEYPPVQLWTPYFESAENLKRFKRLVDPTALQKALFTISETIILPNIQEKALELPRDRSALASLDYTLQRAISEATPESLREAFEELRKVVATRIEEAQPNEPLVSADLAAIVPSDPTDVVDLGPDPVAPIGPPSDPSTQPPPVESPKLASQSPPEVTVDPALTTVEPSPPPARLAVPPSILSREVYPGLPQTDHRITLTATLSNDERVQGLNCNLDGGPIVKLTKQDGKWEGAIEPNSLQAGDYFYTIAWSDAQGREKKFDVTYKLNVSPAPSVEPDPSPPSAISSGDVARISPPGMLEENSFPGILPKETYNGIRPAEPRPQSQPLLPFHSPGVQGGSEFTRLASPSPEPMQRDRVVEVRARDVEDRPRSSVEDRPRGVFEEAPRGDMTLTAKVGGKRVSIDFAFVPKGTFIMGNNANRNAPDWPQHNVSLSKSFYISKQHLTPEQIKILNPKIKNGKPSFISAMEICRAFQNNMDGPAYPVKVPWEAQWVRAMETNKLAPQPGQEWTRDFFEPYDSNDSVHKMMPNIDPFQSSQTSQSQIGNLRVLRPGINGPKSRDKVAQTAANRYYMRLVFEAP